ncbi:hypothetical protein NBH00_05330 [Paraconexibacter antarcticus]|uniref:Uncharacterized protein n=1 Tax=Paraconexibacter antarcticus TaxID=2949664 RepID=A0ABY5DUE8_9ACTN|nr:hypothetical protein [Paraconexibacter antarcticus]UTI65633.1 hypothetical protein NBH00_05330 [Paraconexibacter antarcticus]
MSNIDNPRSDERVATVRVPADKLRVGDRTTYGRVAFAEYVGWITGLNSVQIGLGEEGKKPVFARRRGSEPGVYYPGAWTFHVAASDATAILARPTLMDLHYGRDGATA